MTRLILRVWRFMPYVFIEYKEKACQKSAAALTYMTLFAIVPLMTVTFSMFSVFPPFQAVGEQLQDFIFNHFVPDSGLEVQEYLSAFSSQARSLTIPGIAMLIVTAYLMLTNIEKTFNTIWGVQEGRRGLSSFLIYWAILSLGPILLGLGLGMSTYLISLKLFVVEYDSLGIISWFLQFFPWVLTTAAFTLLFLAVPNCKVPVKHAFAGGVVAAVCFELLKDLFGWIVSHSSFELIYGAFAIVPLFLLWINLLWTIILAGAVLVRTMTTYKIVTAGQQYPDLITTLLSLWEFHSRRTTGGAMNDGELLQIGVDSEQWRRVRKALLSHHVIAETTDGDYVLCRDLETVTLRQIADIINMPTQMPGESDYLQESVWFPDVASRLLSIDQHMEHEFDVTIAQLFSAREELPLYPDEGEGLEQLREQLQTTGLNHIEPAAISDAKAADSVHIEQVTDMEPLSYSSSTEPELPASAGEAWNVTAEQAAVSVSVSLSESVAEKAGDDREQVLLEHGQINQTETDRGQSELESEYKNNGDDHDKKGNNGDLEQDKAC